MDYAPLENSVQFYTHYNAVFEIKINRWDLSTCPSSALGFNGVDVGNFEQRSVHISILRFEKSPYPDLGN